MLRASGGSLVGPFINSNRFGLPRVKHFRSFFLHRPGLINIEAAVYFAAAGPMAGKEK
jgi:hypothetical protein